MSHDPLDIAGQAAEKQRQRTLRKAEAEEHAADIKWLMSSPRGRRLMWQWLSFGGLYRTPYVGDTNRTNFNLGVHSFALMHYTEIAKHAPELILKMTNENGKPSAPPTEPAE